MGRSSPDEAPYDSRPQALAKRVLLVDDNGFARQALVNLFKREGDFEVCGEAANGQEAIRAAQLLNPDLVVLDLAMPVMNGLDAARILKRIMPSVVLIMYSGFGDKYVEHQAQLIGIAALLSKAEPPGVLISLARTLLGNKTLLTRPSKQSYLQT